MVVAPMLFLVAAVVWFPRPTARSTSLVATGASSEGASTSDGHESTDTDTDGAPSTTTNPTVVVPPIGTPSVPPGGIGTPPTPVVPGPLPSPTTTPLSPTTTAPPQGFVVSTRTDRASYTDDQPVVVTVEACNRTSTVRRFAVREGSEAAVDIKDASGRTIATYSTGNAGGAAVEHTFAPGACRTFGPFSWWQEHNNFTGERAHGFPQPRAGIYTAAGHYTGNATTPSDDARRQIEATFELEGVTVDVTTDKPSYRDGETVVANVRVCNPSDRAHVETIVWEPKAEIRIFRDGYTIAQTPNTGPIEAYPLPFSPKQCLDYRYVWSQKAESWDPGTSDGHPSGNRVPTGTYSVEVLWWGHDHADVGRGVDARPGIVPERSLSS